MTEKSNCLSSGQQDVVERFRWWADNYPQTLAVISGTDTATYRDLYEQAAAVAGTLLARHMRPRVLICLEGGISAYAAIIGTLIAGGTFCPVSIDQPDARIAAISSAFSPDVVIADTNIQNWAGETPSLTPQAIKMESRLGAAADQCPRYTGGYVIFTSGSTGIPKGVMVRRECINEFVAGFSKFLAVRPDDRWAQFSKLGFDLSIVDLFMTLTNGAALVSMSASVYRTNPALCIRDFSVTIWHSVPSVMDIIRSARRLNIDYLHTIRVASFCGEPLKSHIVENLFDILPDITILNTYGPTEGPMFCTACSLTKHNYQDLFNGTFPIGSTIEGWRLDLLDPLGKVAADGEIFISGRYLSDGYLNDETMTKQKFVPDKVHAGMISYATGDVAERINGQLYFRGRIDRQVKVRGNRLELAEVELCLQRAFRENCVVFVQDGKLVAVIESNFSRPLAEIRKALSPHLPEYALPSQVIWRDAFPRNANDKIDYAMLQESIDLGLRPNRG